MSICRGCGGVVGRDCWNPSECEWISRDMEARASASRAMREAEDRRLEREYYAAQEAEYRAWREDQECLAMVAESVAPELSLLGQNDAR